MLLALIVIFINKTSENTVSNLNTTQKYSSKGKSDKFLDTSSNENPSSFDSLKSKAYSDTKSGKYQEALDTLDSMETQYVNADNEKKLDIYYNKICCLYNLDSYQEVIDTSKEYLKISNNKILDINIEDYVILSYILLNKNDECEKSILSFLPKYTSSEYQPHEIELNDYLFICYKNSKKYEKALNVSDWLIKKSPDNIEFYIERAVLYNTMKGTKYAYDYLISLRDKFKNNSKLENYIRDYNPNRK